MIVEKEKVFARQRMYLSQGIVNILSIEGFSSLEEGLFIAEIAIVRTAS